MKPNLFLKSLSWLFILNLLVKPVWVFFIDRQVQNQVGYEAYGSYFAIVNLSLVLSFVMDAGIANMMNQRVAAGQCLNTGYYLKLKLCLSLLFLAVMLLAGYLAGIASWFMLLQVAVIRMLGSLLVFLRSIATAHQQFSADARFSVVDKMLMILLCAGFIYFPGRFGTMQLSLFLNIQIFSTALATLLVFLFIWYKKYFTTGVKEDLRQVIEAALPFAAIIFLMSVQDRLDGFLLEQLHPKAPFETGVYASAYRLLDAGNMVGYLAVSFLVPFVSRHQQRLPQVQQALAVVQHALLVFSIGVGCFCVVYGRWVLELLYHRQSGYNTLIIQLCVATLPAYFLIHIYGSVLSATAKLRPFIIILFWAVAINLLLNVLLIPYSGALGSSIAALVSHSFCAAGCLYTCKKLLPDVVPRQNLKYFATVALVLTLYFYLGKVAGLSLWLLAGFAGLFLVVLVVRQTSGLKNVSIASN